MLGNGGRTPHGVRGLKCSRGDSCILSAASHPPRGAWIEILNAYSRCCQSICRTPHGVRGLKCHLRIQPIQNISRTPHGVRGLKSPRPGRLPAFPAGRTPHGVRGLKFDGEPWPIKKAVSHPPRGAWIEILTVNSVLPFFLSHPPRGAWIEIAGGDCQALLPASHPPRGAWIEMDLTVTIRYNPEVAPPTGCVD